MRVTCRIFGMDLIYKPSDVAGTDASPCRTQWVRIYHRRYFWGYGRGYLSNRNATPRQGEASPRRNMRSFTIRLHFVNPTGNRLRGCCRSYHRRVGNHHMFATRFTDSPLSKNNLCQTPDKGWGWIKKDAAAILKLVRGLKERRCILAPPLFYGYGVWTQHRYSHVRCTHCVLPSVISATPTPRFSHPLPRSSSP